MCYRVNCLNVSIIDMIQVQVILHMIDAVGPVMYLSVICNIHLTQVIFYGFMVMVPEKSSEVCQYPSNGHLSLSSIPIL